MMLAHHHLLTRKINSCKGVLSCSSFSKIKKYIIIIDAVDLVSAALLCFIMNGNNPGFKDCSQKINYAFVTF